MFVKSTEYYSVKYWMNTPWKLRGLFMFPPENLLLRYDVKVQSRVDVALAEMEFCPVQRKAAASETKLVFDVVT